MAFDRSAFYDAELGRHNEHFRAALEVGRADRVLDIGCGAGQSTRDAASIAVEGSAVGVDVSAEMIEIARRRIAEAGLRNVAYEIGNAQTHAFAKAHFDLGISRFGTMFFPDPGLAFANIARALRPGARLVMLVWQERENNEWAVAIHDALFPRSPPANASPAFSLGDRERTTRLLATSDFHSIGFTDVHAPVFYGPDIESANEAVVALFVPEDGLAASNPARQQTLERVHALVAAHSGRDGVWFDSRAWIVTARKRGRPATPMKK
jgi:SAM-dependent methyltransferase